jgi:hypothetical protein
VMAQEASWGRPGDHSCQCWTSIANARAALAEARLFDNG